MDINELEEVKKRALALSRTPVGSVRLEYRRLGADQCEVLKYISGLKINNPDIVVSNVFYNMIITA